MIRAYFYLNKSRMTDRKGRSSSYLNLMCNKETSVSQHAVMIDFADVTAKKTVFQRKDRVGGLLAHFSVRCITGVCCETRFINR